MLVLQSLLKPLILHTLGVMARRLTPQKKVIIHTSRRVSERSHDFQKQFRVLGLRFRVWGSGFGLGFRV